VLGDDLRPLLGDRPVSPLLWCLSWPVLGDDLRPLLGGRPVSPLLWCLCWPVLGDDLRPLLGDRFCESAASTCSMRRSFRRRSPEDDA